MPSRKINALIVGGGGREHALGWKVSKSPLVSKVLFAPGNAGTAAVGENVPVAVGDFDGLKKLCLEREVQLVVVGPEDPLCNGLHDSFAEDAATAHIPVIGPKKAGARLEASKEFAKEVMSKHGVPTAAYKSFTKATLADGQKFLETLKPPYVLKADGLAAGKGVLIVPELKQAKEDLASMLSGKFGGASDTVVIEEFMDGKELSVFALVDVKGNFKILPTATDWKRAGNGDTGLNTGGMGAVSPCPYGTEDSKFLNKVKRRVVAPMVKGMLADGLGYTGFLYCGLMRIGDEPKVVEFNCRMGDPETESVMARIKNDLVPLLLAVGKGTLDKKEIVYESRASTTVIVASGGYPGSYAKGKAITGLDQIEKGCRVFHAGTKAEGEAVVTSGGRVLAVTSLGETADAATATAYANVSKVKFEGACFRDDIGTWPVMRLSAGRPNIDRVLRVLDRRGQVEVVGSEGAAGGVSEVAAAAVSAGHKVTHVQTSMDGHRAQLSITLQK